MKRILLMMLLLLVVAGCSQPLNTGEPPVIAYGQDSCDRCGMIISEEKFAAAYWTEDGEARRFDDIGGMFAHNAEENEKVASYWVHDFVTGEWIRAEEAIYVLDSSLMTPMGFGIAAFDDEKEAQALAHGQEGVVVMSFTELRALDFSMSAAMHEEHAP